VTQNMRTMDRRLDAGSVHRTGNNLADRLVRQAPDGCHRGDEDMPVVDGGCCLADYSTANFPN
jgi:hypothetical protein